MPNLYAALVIRNADGKFLTVKHNKPWKYVWRFAGGKIEAGEQPIIAAARELEEELGLVAHSLRLVAVPTNLHEDGEKWTGYYFLADDVCGFPKIMEPTKHEAFAYLSVDELKSFGSPASYDVAHRVEQGA